MNEKIEKTHRGLWLKQTAKDYGYTAETIGQLIGASRSTVWRWLKTKNLSFLKMKEVCDALGVDLIEAYPEAKEFFPKAKKNYEQLYLKSLETISELEAKIKKLETEARIRS